MGVKEGYKQTEVGVIPEDWEVWTIGQIGKFSKGQGIRKDEASSGNIPCVRYGEIYTLHSNYIKRFGSFISREVSKTSKMLKKGDILFAGSGETKEEIGKSVAFIDNFEAYVGGDVIVLSPEYGDSLFYGYIFNSPVVARQKASKGQGDAVVHISASNLSNIQVPLPPTIEEQKAIAKALSDIDGLIDSLSKLIEKKKKIKKGAMHELFTPKEHWQSKPLKEVASYRRGSFPQPYGLDKWYDDISGFPFVQVYDVSDSFKLNKETKRRISSEAKKMSVFAKKGTVILTIQGSIGRIAITQYDAYIDRTLLVFEKFLMPFNKYFFLLIVYLLFAYEKQNAPGGIIRTITKEALSKFIITFPPIKEQQAIATIISDMDLEIEKLKAKLEKYKAIKKGMMQELLTGRIRLLEGA